MYGKNERPNQMYEKKDKWLKNIPQPFNYLFRNTGCLILSRRWKFILSFNVNENLVRNLQMREMLMIHIWITMTRYATFQSVTGSMYYVTYQIALYKFSTDIILCPTRRRISVQILLRYFTIYKPINETLKFSFKLRRYLFNIFFSFKKLW